MPDAVSPPETVLPPADPAPSYRRGSLLIREVRVYSEEVEANTAPPSIWTPPDDPSLGLDLMHEPGEVLDSNWVRRQFASLIAAGEAMTLERAVGLVQLINRAYLTAGFVNSGLVVPEQPALEEGVLELRLVLGRLAASETDEDAIMVQWGPGGPGGLGASYLRDRFPSANNVPFNALALERDFRLLAEDPFIRTINVDLRPGAVAGEATLRVTVFPAERFDFYLSAANDRSPSVGGERIATGGYFRNAIASGDLLWGEAGLTEGAEDLQLTYSAPFISPRTTLSLRASLNDAAVIDRPLIPLDIRAEERSGEVGLSHRIVARPLTPTADPGRWSSSRSLTLGALLTHRRQKSFLLGEPFSFAPGSVNGRTEYSAARLTADYLVRNVDQVFAAAMTATMGLDGTRSDDPAIPNPSRNFKSLLVQLNYARRLGDNGLELRARLAGQMTDGILYSAERLSIGGETSVRGYRESLFLVDRGAVGSVELAQPFSLSGRRRASASFDWGAFEASAFVDGAVFRNADPPQPAASWIAGTGVSLSWVPSDAIVARASYGFDLREIPLAGSRDLQDGGFHFRVTLYPLRLFRR